MKLLQIIKGDNINEESNFGVSLANFLPFIDVKIF